MTTTEPPEHRTCRQLADDEQAQPRGRILDGPAAGTPTRSHALGRWSPTLCHRSGLGPWQHHVHEGDGGYRHVGPCDDLHPEGDYPDGFGPMCPGVDNTVDSERIEP
mgnify:CR=1 FL=1